MSMAGPDGIITKSREELGVAGMLSVFFYFTSSSSQSRIEC